MSPKVIQKRPQTTPKTKKIDSRGPFKTYGIYCVGATWGTLGGRRKHHFFLDAFQVPILVSKTAKMYLNGAPRATPGTPKGVPKSNKIL